jgi:hypothetical protein
MDEARHHFLAGARLAEQQHRGFVGPDLRCLGEHLLPRRGFADHAVIAGPRVELVGQRLHPRLERGQPRRGLVGFLRHGAPALADELLGQSVRDAPGHRHSGSV